MDDAERATARNVTHQFGFMLRVAQSAVWQNLIATFEPFSIKPQQYALMSLIDLYPGSTLDSLAQELRIRAPNLVGFVEDLASRGLVVRRKRPNDRRVNVLNLTAPGQALLAELKIADDGHERTLFETLGPARLDALMDDLRKLATLDLPSELPPSARRE
ncbi:MarR family winged helix-turn-helix transcriptional regulator [Sphingomonas sp. BIUV-7]|uniref:MarR family winged helix-turn-helix transcriptional regulator n=1 Tax=Sphingomonas natans TaxID=3063330 RepID=A0ABT8Y8R4_9SPHN|nr:MarR family winged helix-turn-helix transcriptional regulator [Sphingomonas sp. BIUV-7]MDO6414721.1 MarR family winged helix-turn-helix transcriptional regulator [Sphingomonas sp. BIUV-7]